MPKNATGGGGADNSRSPSGGCLPAAALNVSAPATGELCWSGAMGAGRENGATGICADGDGTVSDGPSLDRTRAERPPETRRWLPLSKAAGNPVCVLSYGLGCYTIDFRRVITRQEEREIFVPAQMCFPTNTMAAIKNE